ncbi:MAG: ThuA domain-containing protein [Chitinophagaceae bacterium]|jgi:type 1 glutamine amidotransferase|nr:ThuA domain-containing protein [Chitinophagaceae bacterium]
MRFIHYLLLITLFLFIASATSKQKKKILVFSKTVKFRHTSIEKGKAALMLMGKENNFLVDTTENAAYFTAKKLKQYDAVVFLSTTGDVLNNEQQAAFEAFIRSGKGFVGIHAAADTEYDWPWYGRMVGAYFSNHPKQQKAKLTVTNDQHPSTKHLPKTWERFDEWYNYKNRNADVKVLLTIDESSYEGGKEGAYHPMAWFHSFEGGRVFYTALGHTDESYKEEAFLKHLLGGIKYVLKK